MEGDKMINCSKCGAPLEDNSFFCSSCGQIVTIAGSKQSTVSSGNSYGSGASQQNPQSSQQSAYNSYGNSGQQSAYNSYGTSGQQFGSSNAAFSANSGSYNSNQGGMNRSAYQGQNGYNANNYASAVSAVSAANKRKIFTFGKERKEQRFNFIGNTDAILSDNAYCGWLGGTVLYGLLVNVIICLILEHNMNYVIYRLFSGSGYIAVLIGYFVLCFAGTIISNASTKPLVSFIGYNMVVLPVGFLASISVFIYGGIRSNVVTTAIFITLAVTFIMTALSIAKPKFFESLGKVLGTTLLILLVVSAISAFIGHEYFIWTYIGAGLFSLYIGYDLYRAMQFPHTKDNAIDCALDIYLDIINLFLKVLQILAKANSRRK